ncbi:MAG: zinc-binding dehydrogenase [Acidimicrobiia bacterium]
MRALIVTPESALVTLADVPEPELHRDDVLVRVHAFSLNRGEVTRLLSPPHGWQPGWDFAGVVEQPNGSDLSVGDRVLGVVRQGAWAEYVAAPRGHLGAVPDTVTFAEAASLPIAGLTALRSLRVAGPILGRSVLITGAGGSVGRFAIQLATLGGAETCALVRSESHVGGLQALGAPVVATSIETLDSEFDLILETVGGETLGKAMLKLTPQGRLVIIGNTSNELTTFDARGFYPGGSRQLIGFALPATYAADPPALDLSYLAAEVARGRLDPQVAEVFDWYQMETAIDHMRYNSSAGRTVLRTSAEPG